LSKLGPSSSPFGYPVLNEREKVVHTQSSQISAMNASRIMQAPTPYDSAAMERRGSRPQEPADDLNTIVQTNICRILAGRAPEAYCKEKNRVLYYVTGVKKGKPVAPRALRYAISQEQSPRLDMIAAIAHKEGLPAYQLLINHIAPPAARRWDDFRPDVPVAD
jgi:hypothetical protein